MAAVTSAFAGSALSTLSKSAVNRGEHWLDTIAAPLSLRGVSILSVVGAVVAIVIGAVAIYGIGVLICGCAVAAWGWLTGPGKAKKE